MKSDHFQNEHEDLQSLFQRTRPRETAVDIDRIAPMQTARPKPVREAILPRRQLVVAAFLFGMATSLLLLLMPNRSAEGLAFAQVKEQVERVRTVDYVQTSLVVDETPEGAVDTRYGDQTPRAVLKKRVDSLETRLKTADPSEREDITFRLALLRSYLDPQTTELPDDIRRVRIKGKQLQRTDHIFPSGEFHDVRNARTGETVSFDHKQKTRRLLTTQVRINRETGKTTEEPITTPRTVDFFHRFRAIPENAAQRLPGKEIDGQQVIGFRSTEEHETGTWTRTFWVDEKTKLPVQIVTDFKSHQKGLSSSKWIQDHFVFDRELDDALFSTKTPDGYTEKEEKVYGFE